MNVAGLLVVDLIKRLVLVHDVVLLSQHISHCDLCSLTGLAFVLIYERHQQLAEPTIIYKSITKNTSQSTYHLAV